MKKGRIYVDFNEIVEGDLVLLSKNDSEVNSLGEIINLYQGLRIDIYSDDENEIGETDNLVASGIVEKNETELPWTKYVKWLCRIDSNGIKHESELQQ